MAVPTMDATGLDTSDALFKNGAGGSAPMPMDDPPQTEGEASDQVSLVDDHRLLKLHQTAVSQATTYLTTVKTSWDRSYRAFRNEHFAGSKYLSEPYKGRSKTFRPKTRAAVNKMLASTAKALFATGDVVAVAPENEADPGQTVSASLKQELLNYRLSRNARRNGIPWTMTALGARLNSAITGICASKQQWLYREEEVDPGSEDSIHPETGELIAGQAPRTEIILDRPDILLFPSENVLFDPNCDWTAPAQSSAYLVLLYPMNLGDALTLVRSNQGQGMNIPWRDISETELKSAVSSTGPSETTGTRAARNGGKDPVAQATGEFAPCWLAETFMRVDGQDVVFWTINNTKIISDPVPVRDAYPEQHGERPVIIGYASVDAHRPYPMSPVESWQPLQQEANDVANLRLDHMKQVVAPPVKVKRGRKVDLTQVQRRAQNSVVMLQDMADVEWAEVPDVPPSSYQETNYINADFDDLAGIFNSGSVQTNRAMNETVGGMRLLSGDANTVADLNLEIWVETWVEPALFQVLRLEEFYESDAKVLAIAGERAKLWEKFGVDAITDEMLLAESTLSIKVGVGASNDPQSRLQNFMMAAQAAQGVLMPFVQGGMLKVIPNGEEIMNTIFGAAGFKDGGDRFFQVEPMDPSQQPNPAAMEAQNKAKELELKDKKIQSDAVLKDRDLKVKGAQAALSFHDAQEQRMAEMLKERMRSHAEIEKADLEAHHGAANLGRTHAHDRNMLADSVMGETLKTIFNPPPPPKAPGASAGAQ
jgi:hypothetical protein